MNTVVEPTTSTEPTEPTPETEPTTTESDSTLLTGGERDEPEFAPYTVEDIQLPEGGELDETLANGFLEVANELQLPRESMDKLVTLHNEAMARASDAISEVYNTMQEQWREEARTDPVIGGEKLGSVLAGVKEMIKEVSGEDLDSVLSAFDLTGAGNNPAIIKFLHRLAEGYKEGKAVTGQPAGDQPLSLAERMYPNQGKT